jgi:hypothetical protein
VDLAGPFHRSIQRGELFALIVTDRGTRFRWVWPLKQKSDAAEAFDRFIDTDVRPRGYVARSVRCDSGGEFLGNEFRDVCAQRGIHFDPAAARTPSQNSISESSVRVLEAAARCLALESGAPASFWPFMMAAAALTNNCLSTAAVGMEGDAVPWQRWHGTAPPVERLRVFGCLAWVNADDRRERRQGDKFGARGARCTFLGCASEGLAWLCWDGQRIRTSVHVKFQEHRMPWREKPPPAGTPLGLGAVLLGHRRRTLLGRPRSSHRAPLRRLVAVQVRRSRRPLGRRLFRPRALGLVHDAAVLPHYTPFGQSWVPSARQALGDVEGGATDIAAALSFDPEAAVDFSGYVGRRDGAGPAGSPAATGP